MQAEEAGNGPLRVVEAEPQGHLLMIDSTRYHTNITLQRQTDKDIQTWF